MSGSPAADPDEAARRRTRFARLGLGGRLFAATTLVVAAGSGTLLAVALLIAPQVFLIHLRRARTPDLSDEVRTHVDRAFTQATLISLGVGITVAVIAAGLVTWLIVRRLAAPVATLAAATTRLADGNYDADLRDPRLGPEFAALTSAVNQLARRLATSEEIRRRLLGDLAHELRTPIASLEATVEAVVDGVLPVDAATLDTLTDQAGRLRRLVADVEAVSRAEERQLALHPRPTPLADLARRAVAALRSRYEAKSVTLDVEAAVPGPIVTVDADRLVEALMNVLDNALQHTPEGGTVTVTVAAPGPQRAAPARLTVTDTGEGFDPAHAALLFERFYRADPARAGGSATTPSPGRHGSGIGLTITRAIIEAQHGQITAHSPGLGRGATFAISLPAAPRPRTGRLRSR
jgi:two-component system sensor histidine kinase BaeS